MKKRKDKLNQKMRLLRRQFNIFKEEFNSEATIEMHAHGNMINFIVEHPERIDGNKVSYKLISGTWGLRSKPDFKYLVNLREQIKDEYVKKPEDLLEIYGLKHKT